MLDESIQHQIPPSSVGSILPLQDEPGTGDVPEFIVPDAFIPRAVLVPDRASYSPELIRRSQSALDEIRRGVSVAMDNVASGGIEARQSHDYSRNDRAALTPNLFDSAGLDKGLGAEAWNVAVASLGGVQVSVSSGPRVYRYQYTEVKRQGDRYVEARKELSETFENGITIYPDRDSHVVEDIAPEHIDLLDVLPLGTQSLEDHNGRCWRLGLETSYQIRNDPNKKASTDKNELEAGIMDSLAEKHMYVVLYQVPTPKN